MINLSLNGKWQMKRTDWSQWIDAVVPGSVYTDLLNAGLIQDPFYRDNEENAKDISRFDYVYYRKFTVDSDLLKNDRVILRCEGLDTLASIRINDQIVANTNNMHRTYEFDIKQKLSLGENSIEIILYSPVEYIEKKQRENPLWGVGDAISGYPHIRKAHYMFGWDWGPQIPDAGIWRSISIIGYSIARLEDVYITQHHVDQKVTLDIRVRNQKWGNEPVDVKVSITTPDGVEISNTLSNCACKEHFTIEIPNPQLWWPNGFGKQPLYKVEVMLMNKESILDAKDFNIGLRTLKVRRNKDQWGESFAFEVNGVSIFAMGANYIPEDNLLGRCTPERTERLIKHCVEANFNCLRVWGGGIYPPDYFYDLCDKYGIIVWQDLMFSCAVYDMTDEFAENIKKEVEDNIRRIRHHASLGLWCGNNEMEWGWEDWGFPKTQKLRTDYIKQFEILLPQVAKENDPNTFYWPSSPSSGGGFDKPNDENRGDVHYWEIWQGIKPISDYRNHYFRFVSEFGFQAFPCLKTIESFTLPEDRNIFSYVMERHQKNFDGNRRLLYYMSESFKYPKDFNLVLYTSQVLQAEAIKYGVEHWRRNRGRCMGTIYWQLNDCWPVASWSSIDYYGRRKALHYYAKRFFVPILLSAREEGTGAELNIANETRQKIKGEVVWALRDNTSTILRKGSKAVEVDALSSLNIEKLDFSDLLRSKKEMRKAYLEFALVIDGNIISSGTVLFVKPKHFEFLNPQIEADVREEEDKYIITLLSKAFAKSVELDINGMDCIFSDNYFDMTAGIKKFIEVRKDSMSKITSIDELKQNLMVRSLFDIA